MSKLQLLEGERLVMDVSPTPNFKRYVTVNVSVRGLPFLAMINVLFAMFFYIGTGGTPVTIVGFGPILATYFLLLLVLATILVALTFVFANLMCKKYHYWVTDQRVIWRHGIIGYKVTSVPFERISDVAVSRTFLETMCGVGGVIVREMGGEVGYAYPYGWAGRVFPTMIAVPDPEGMQKQILELVGKKRKENNIPVQRLLIAELPTESGVPKTKLKKWVLRFNRFQESAKISCYIVDTSNSKPSVSGIGSPPRKAQVNSNLTGET